MYFTVYQTVNKINNKVYIGKHQTKKIDDSYIGSGKRLQLAMWITNGVESKRIKKSEFIPEGWNKGRICRNRLIERTRELSVCH